MYPPLYNDSPNEVGFKPTSTLTICYPLYYTPTPPLDLSPQRSDSPNELGLNPKFLPPIRYPLYSTPTPPHDISIQISPPRNSTKTAGPLHIIIDLIYSEEKFTSSDEKQNS